MVRFDKPCHQVHSAVRYFRTHMGKQEYLTEAGRVEMTWYGHGAEQLGLSGLVEEADFVSLCKGRNPHTNEKLVLRDCGANRRVCYFGQISAPKDVSIAYLVGGDKRIAGWWQESVKETFKELESLTTTRVRLQGAVEDRVTGNIVAAVVTHDTSRSLDPQLHTHVCVMNVTYDAIEQRWKAVDPHAFYKYQSYLREVSYNKLAEKMKEGGYQIEKARTLGFRLQGFPAELREEFSKRREEIERVADVLKKHDQDTLQAITSKTRADKVHLQSHELKTRWLSEASPHLPSLKGVIEQAQPSNYEKSISPAQALFLGQAHLFDRLSVVDEKFILREALIAGRGEISLDEVKKELADRIQSGDLLERGKLVTTPENFRLEQGIIEWTNRGKKTFPAMGKFMASSTLSAEQNHAAEKLLNSQDRVTVLMGDAGAGKSTTLSAIIQGVHQSGNLTFACAPSAIAAQELRDKLSIQADTVQQLIANTKLQEQVDGRTLIVDEAGLLSVRQMHDLFQIAERQRCRVLLVGDTKQHHSVEAGDALRALQAYAQLEPVRLQEIHRQKREDYKEVVKLLAKGQPYVSLQKLDQLGGVQENKDWNSVLDQAATAYVEKTAQGHSSLAISPVWSEVNAFTVKVRAELKEKGLLGREEKTYQSVQSMQWTPALKAQHSHYQIGDVLTFHRDTEPFQKHEMVKVIAKDFKRLIVECQDGSRRFFDPAQHKNFDVGLPRQLAIAPGEKLLVRANFPPGHLKNGDVVTVQQVKEDGSITLHDGRVIPTYFRQFTHGYASTSHSAQSKTVDHGILILGGKGFAAANLQQAYVSNSRFSQTQTLFTTDKQQAFDAMARFEKRPLALEVITTMPNAKILQKPKIDPVPDITPQEKTKEVLDWKPIKPQKIGLRL